MCSFASPINRKKKKPASDTQFPFSLPPSLRLPHKRTHREWTLLSAQRTFAPHIQHIICFARSRTPVPHFIKGSQASFLLSGHVSQYWLRRGILHRPTHALSATQSDCCRSRKRKTRMPHIYFLFLYWSTGTGILQLTAGNVPYVSFEKHRNWSGDPTPDQRLEMSWGKSIHYLIMLSLARFAEDARDLIPPRFLQMKQQANE